MPISRNGFICAAVAAALMAGACSVQTTSGRDYLKTFPAQPNQTALMKSVAPPTQIVKDGNVYVLQGQGTPPPTFEQRMRDVASVEPLLRFPARIGLARMEYSQLTAVPADEMKEWEKMGDNLGQGFGTLVPISPMIVQMAAASPMSDTGYAGGGYQWTPGTPGSTNDVVSAIRLGAARQHVDAVLIYDVSVNTQEDDNALSWANITIIGAMVLPGYEIEGSAQANAMLIDVRNSYPYAHTSVVAEASSSSTAVRTHTVRKTIADSTRQQAVADLAKDVEGMVRQLRMELAELPAPKGGK